MYSMGIRLGALPMNMNKSEYLELGYRVAEEVEVDTELKNIHNLPKSSVIFMYFQI